MVSYEELLRGMEFARSAWNMMVHMRVVRSEVRLCASPHYARRSITTEVNQLCLDSLLIRRNSPKSYVVSRIEEQPR